MRELTIKEKDYIESLISKMTTHEKVGQLNLTPLLSDEKEMCELAQQGLIGGVVLAYTPLAGSEQRRAYAAYRHTLQRVAVSESRLGIPILFGRDVIHGHRTVFPVPLGQAASFDDALIEKAASIAASEARQEGIKWAFAPMADVSRDARWGRVVEGYGEDTFLTSRLTRAAVRGFQSEGIAACVKHFMGYGAVEGGRDYNTSEISETTLREIYLPPFTAAVDEGVMTVMTAFHDIGGEALTASRRLVTGLLKEELGFQGFVVSDWSAVAQLVRQGLAADRKQAAKLAFNAGIDMDMSSGCFLEYLSALVESREVSVARLDDAVKRVLRVKLTLGLLDAPVPETTPLLHIPKEYRLVAKECAAASCVLLKNSNSLLPLPKRPMKVALIGPYASDFRNSLGSWTLDGREEDTIALAQGLLDANPQLHLSEAQLGSAEAASRDADYVIVAIGEHWDDSGEARGSSNLTIPVEQIDLLKRVYAINNNTIVVLSSGRPLVLDNLLDHCASMLLAWHGGTMAGAALGELIFGDAAPQGKLPMTFPRSASHYPLYYNPRNSCRDTDEYYEKAEYPGYLDSSGKPLFPFGYGLTYTTFSFTKPCIEVCGRTLRISAVLKNTGTGFGVETAQCYASLLGGSIVRPTRMLVGYQKICLKAQEEETVFFSYELPPDIHAGYIYIGGDCLSAKSIEIPILKD